MSEYVFRYAPGYGCDMSALMDGGRVTVGEYFASDSTDHYGTLHEEIVRCMDCKYVSRDEKIYRKCYRFYGYNSFTVEEYGFCAWGERKDGGDD